MKLAIISDIHGNMEAFEKVWEDIQEQGVSHIYCLGDSIGYGPDSESVVRRVKELGFPHVLGNHELALVRRHERGWFNPIARKTLLQIAKTISKQSSDYIKTMPEVIQEHGCIFVHGCPPDQVKTYLFQLSDEELLPVMQGMEQPLCFVGHTHELEMVALNGETLERTTLGQNTYVLGEDKRYIINAGSVGQPRDGNNKAKYVLWAPKERLLTVRYITYDYKTTAQKILDQGLPEQYARRLGLVF